MTVADSDNEYDSVSNLSRSSVFRVNIGVSRDTFEALVGDVAEPDYTALDTFLPHPDYAKQNFVCILNPSGGNDGKTQRAIEEAHGIAAARYRRKND